MGRRSTSTKSLSSIFDAWLVTSKMIGSTYFHSQNSPIIFLSMHRLTSLPSLQTMVYILVSTFPSLPLPWTLRRRVEPHFTRATSWFIIGAYSHWWTIQEAGWSPSICHSTLCRSETWSGCYDDKSLLLVHVRNLITRSWNHSESWSASMSSPSGSPLHPISRFMRFSMSLSSSYPIMLRDS